MKWLKGIVIGILVIIVVLWAIVKITTKYSSVTELEALFLENEEKFCTAAEILTNVCSENDNNIKIYTENFYANSSSNKIFVEQVGELYFISFDHPYSHEDCIKMYDAVNELFSSHELWGITGSAYGMTFCASLSYGIECDIIYSKDGTVPTVQLTVKEQTKICDGWYAIISHD